MGHTPPPLPDRSSVDRFKSENGTIRRHEFLQEWASCIILSVRESSSWNTFIRVFLHHGWRLAWLQCWIRDKRDTAEQLFIEALYKF